MNSSLLLAAVDELARPTQEHSSAVFLPAVSLIFSCFDRVFFFLFPSFQSFPFSKSPQKELTTFSISNSFSLILKPTPTRALSSIYTYSAAYLTSPLLDI